MLIRGGGLFVSPEESACTHCVSRANYKFMRDSYQSLAKWTERMPTRPDYAGEFIICNPLDNFFFGIVVRAFETISNPAFASTKSRQWHARDDWPFVNSLAGRMELRPQKGSPPTLIVATVAIVVTILEPCEVIAGRWRCMSPGRGSKTAKIPPPPRGGQGGSTLVRGPFPHLCNGGRRGVLLPPRKNTVQRGAHFRPWFLLSGNKRQLRHATDFMCSNRNFAGSFAHFAETQSINC